MNEDSDEVGRLLRAAGRRTGPAPDALQRIRDHAHSQWRSTLRRRVRLHLFAAAASVLALLGGTWLFIGNTGGARAQSARVIHGGEFLNVERHASTSDPELLSVGDRVSTGAIAGALLAQLPGGVTTLRLDRSTTVEWVGPGELRLVRGRLYVDSGNAAAGRPARDALVIDAGAARIQHLGTQFLTAIDAGRVVVGVRDGLVKVAVGNRSANFARGEIATVNAAGAVGGTAAIARGRVATSGAAWQWADALAPRLPIEGRNLVDVLRALAYQAGLTLSFANPSVEAEAFATILHGPALDMTPDTALRAILATTSFATVTTTGSADRIVIERR
jgi:ferric-dicitrate binding protein FerR (iron transport regulator)